MTYVEISIPYLTILYLTAKNIKSNAKYLFLELRVILDYSRHIRQLKDSCLRDISYFMLIKIKNIYIYNNNNNLLFE